MLIRPTRTATEKESQTSRVAWPPATLRRASRQQRQRQCRQQQYQQRQQRPVARAAGGVPAVQLAAPNPASAAIPWRSRRLTRRNASRSPTRRRQRMPPVADPAGCRPGRPSTIQVHRTPRHPGPIDAGRRPVLPAHLQRAGRQVQYRRPLPLRHRHHLPLQHQHRHHRLCLRRQPSRRPRCHCPLSHCPHPRCHRRSTESPAPPRSPTSPGAPSGMSRRLTTNRARGPTSGATAPRFPSLPTAAWGRSSSAPTVGARVVGPQRMVPPRAGDRRQWRQPSR